jgi:transcriptional regulator with XRE-family HTH domain
MEEKADKKPRAAWTYDLVGQRLHDERRRQFLTIDELAKKSDLHFQTVWRLENGYPAKATTIRKLSAALGIDPTDLAEL